MISASANCGETSNPPGVSVEQAKANTAGSGWFDLPAFPGAEPKKKSGQSSSAATSGGSSSDARHPTAEQMRREVQAIRLRNAMDPKRFYRGGDGAGEKGMPKFAQVRFPGRALQPPAVQSDVLIYELVASSSSARLFRLHWSPTRPCPGRSEVGQLSRSLFATRNLRPMRSASSQR